MIEVDFKDRLSKYPGRVKMTPVPGQMDVFEMVRMDEPTEPGTPLDKATFDSIIESRLTGRYYEPTVTRTVLSEQKGLTVNPMPANYWAYSSTTAGWTGSWTIETSSTDGTSYPWNALDGNTATSWVSGNGTTQFWKISSGAPIKLKKFKVQFSGSMAAELQGSNDGGTWKHITHLSNAGSLAEYSINDPVSYNYHRVLFTSTTAGKAGLNEFVISEYDISKTSNAFEITNGLPVEFYKLQRLTIQTGDNFDTSGVVSNTLNGLPVNTILQPNKRYELVWLGVDFTAKEV